MPDINYMMTTPLITSDIIEYAELVYPEVEVFSRENDGVILTTNYAQIAQNSRSFASALVSLGIKKGVLICT